MVNKRGQGFEGDEGERKGRQEKTRGMVGSWKNDSLLPLFPAYSTHRVKDRKRGEKHTHTQSIHFASIVVPSGRERPMDGESRGGGERRKRELLFTYPSSFPSPPSFSLHDSSFRLKIRTHVMAFFLHLITTLQQLSIDPPLLYQ